MRMTFTQKGDCEFMKAKTKQILFPVIAIAISFALAAGMIASKTPPEKKNQEKAVPFVATEIVEVGPYKFKVHSQGLVEARHQTDLVAQVSGEITEVAEVFVRGGIVRKGDVLAQIDPFNYQVKLQQANASLASARAAFILERAQGQVAEAEWKNITSAEPSELGLRKPQQEQALASVKAAEAALQQAQKDLERTTIQAPFDGIVQSRSVSPGSFVNIGSQIGSLMDVAVAEVRLPINKDDFRYLQGRGLDTPVTLTAQMDDQQLQWQARIIRDEGVVDETTRMIYLVAALADPYGLQSPDTTRLPFGTFVQASIAGRELASAARIPRSAIRDGHAATIVDGTLHLQPVTVERNEGKYSVVSDGLVHGDRLMVSALDNPTDGMQVNYAEEKQAAQVSAAAGGGSN